MTTTKDEYKINIVRGRKCDMVYKATPTATEAQRCIPHKDYLLFECKGALTKTTPIRTYLVLAKTAREAKREYEKVFSWKCTETRLLTEADERESILSNPLKMPT